MLTTYTTAHSYVICPVLSPPPPQVICARPQQSIFYQRLKQCENTDFSQLETIATTQSNWLVAHCLNIKHLTHCWLVSEPLGLQQGFTSLGFQELNAFLQKTRQFIHVTFKWHKFQTKTQPLSYLIAINTTCKVFNNMLIGLISKEKDSFIKC